MANFDSKKHRVRPLALNKKKNLESWGFLEINLELRYFRFTWLSFLKITTKKR